MQRCIELARSGAGMVSPNPMVGAVLVHEDRIIGEGYHAHFGQAHAEVNCLNSVKPEDRPLIHSAVMYVSLEPCAHFGKTPPCADRIVREGIKKVVIGCRDPFKEVDGKGVEKLQKAGVEVELGILENECRDLNKRFFTFHTRHRPYIILKWAQTANLKIAAGSKERLLISNEFTNRKVHRWRSEEAAILVGKNTVMKDDPVLTNRLWDGPSPVRLVIDMDLQLPASAKVFNQDAPTVVFNKIRHSSGEQPVFYQVTEDVNLIHQVVHALYRLNILSVLVEGGARLLQSFIDEGLWDEARIITNTEMVVEEGLAAPVLPEAAAVDEELTGSDRLVYFKPLTHY